LIVTHGVVTHGVVTHGIVTHGIVTHGCWTKCVDQVLAHCSAFRGAALDDITSKVNVVQKIIRGKLRRQ